MKFLFVYLGSVIGSIIITLRLIFQESVSGDFIVLDGIVILGWYRCRELKNLSILSLYNFNALIRIDNVDTDFRMTNVEVSYIYNR